MEELLRLPMRVQIASDPAQLPIVRATVERVCDVVGLDDQAGDKVALAVDEALT
ncbi:hypothetical protein LCGC14_2306830, partial [marine sediment metagenome]